MSYTSINYHDGEEKATGMYFCREELDCEQLGVTVIDCEPGWEGMEHDHADRDHEEVYVLVEGEAAIEIDGETVSMTEGDLCRVAPEATRRIRNGDRRSQFVVAGAP